LLIIPIYIAWRTVKATEEKNITERYSKAVEQLGDKEKLEVRLGGIYDLERIAKDSKKDYWRTINVLIDFIRGKTSYIKHNSDYSIPPDVQAALKVIKQPHYLRGLRDGEIDLRGSYLKKADLKNAFLNKAYFIKVNFVEANLQKARLFKANLSEANLCKADMTDAYLIKANFYKTILTQANLKNANLKKANLEQANLREANLEQANLRESKLTGADLKGANLSKAIGLTQEQISQAFIDRTTTLPSYLPLPVSIESEQQRSQQP
jgi:Pentapeptide repeats (8 copies)